MCKHKNISLLILAFLALIFYPGVIKLLHVHERLNYIVDQEKGSFFIPKEDSCPVCDFQFVSFITTFSDQVMIYQGNVVDIDSKIPESYGIQYLIYFSLRAPPII
jgi:hypothetical protein